jgi:transcriptional regulator NrdR family protein
MTCIPIKDGILCISGLDFYCPHCGYKYTDVNDKWLDKINKAKWIHTKVKCVKCGKKFYLSYNTKGEFVTWK